MKYTIVFGLLGVYLIVLACALEDAAWLLAWPGISFLVLAAGYAGLGPGVCGKRRDGRLAWWATLLMLPYLLLTWLVWYGHRLLSREPCCNEIVPGLWIGRRVGARELPPGVGLVVDLTAEFSEPRGVRCRPTYVCLPVLDAQAPPEHELRRLVEMIAGWRGGVYVHCALGHGRSALVAAAVLLQRGLANDPRQAEALVRRARPSVGLKPAQRRLLGRMFAGVPPLSEKT